MSNPIMQAMSGPTATSSSTNSLGRIIQMLRSGNPEQIAQSLMQNNPQFRAFVQANQGKSPEQVAREHGVNLSVLLKQI